MKLLVGLGNPGKEYEQTLHNAGFMSLDYLAKHFGFEPFHFSKKNNSEITEEEIAEEKVMMVKPQTYMNLSGQAVQSIAQFYKIPTSDIVVVHDDADLPLGTFRIRPSGSSGGHKGVQSIISQLGPDFVRIRLGIQPKTPFPGELEDYVLGKWTSEEKKKVKEVLPKLPDLLETLLKEGIEEAMQRFN